MPDNKDIADNLAHMGADEDPADALARMGGPGSGPGVAARASAIAARDGESAQPIQVGGVSAQQARAKIGTAGRQALLGVLLVIAGIGLSIATFLSPTGGIVIFYGLPLAGLGMVADGLVKRSRFRQLAEFLERKERSARPPSR